MALIQQGFKILELIEKLDSKKSKSPEIIMGLKIYKAAYIIDDPWEKRLKQIEEVIKELEQVDYSLQLNFALILKSIIIRLMHRHEESLLVLEEAERRLTERYSSEEEKYKIGISNILREKGYYYSYTGEIELAHKIYNKGLKIVKTITDNEVLLSSYYLAMSLNSFFKGNYNDTIRYAKEIIRIGEDLNDDYIFGCGIGLLAEILHRVGRYEESLDYLDQVQEIIIKTGATDLAVRKVYALNYYDLGEIKKANETFRELLPEWERVKGSRSIAMGLWMKSSIERHEGSIEKAVEYLSESVEILKDSKDKFLKTLYSIYLAITLFDKGDYDKALEIGMENFKDFEQYENIQINSNYYELLAKIYHVKGNYNLAIENGEKSLELRKTMVRISSIIQLLFLLVTITIDKNDPILYNKYLNELGDVVDSNPSFHYKQIYRIAQALVFKTSTRPKDWMKALEILESVVDEEIENNQFAIIALNNLCELLMIEFSISGDEHVLTELEDHNERLASIAKYQNNYALKLEATNIQLLTLWLKAQYSMTDLDMQNARELLTESRNLADQEGLIRLAEKMSQQQERLLGQVSQWDDFIRKYYEFIKNKQKLE